MSRDGSADGRPVGRVAVLGAHIVDVLGRPVESIPPGQGSTRLTEIRATAAGTAAGTGVDLAKLGAEVLAVGAIGDDLLAEVLTGAMRVHGVDTSGLVRKQGAQTSATILPIRPNGERPALHVPGATPLLDLADINAVLAGVGRLDALLVGAPDALGPVAEAGLAGVASAVKADGALVAVDVLRPGSPRDFGRIASVLAVADWFLPNADQLAALTGHDDPVDAVREILDLGTGGVAVTLGAEGAIVQQGSHDPVHVPAIEVDVVDTTGCGDGFNAGMLTALLLGADSVDAAWLGVACGALVATGLGSDSGIVDLAHALDFLHAAAPGPADRIGALSRHRHRPDRDNADLGEPART